MEKDIEDLIDQANELVAEMGDLTYKDLIHEMGVTKETAKYLIEAITIEE